MGSFVSAKSANGRWLVRIEDLDVRRNQPGAADAILLELERLGLDCDDEVVFQSRRGDLYAAALKDLRSRGLAYPCGCSRRDFPTTRYPGTCRLGLAPGKQARSIRYRTQAYPITFLDRVQGILSQTVERDVGDFVIHRADDIPAYHLAVVVDDLDQGITEIVRGADILSSTPRQIALIESLGGSIPAYAHLPIAANGEGQKLSKQTYAQPTATENATALLSAALDFLGQSLPKSLRQAGPRKVLEFAIGHWRVIDIPRRRSIKTD